MAGPLANWLRQLLAEALRFDHQAVANPEHMGEQLWALALQGLLVVVPLGLLVVAGAGGAPKLEKADWAARAARSAPTTSRCSTPRRSGSSRPRAGCGSS